MYGSASTCLSRKFLEFFPPDAILFFKGIFPHKLPVIGLVSNNQRYWFALWNFGADESICSGNHWSRRIPQSFDHIRSAQSSTHWTFCSTFTVEFLRISAKDFTEFAASKCLGQISRRKVNGFRCSSVTFAQTIGIKVDSEVNIFWFEFNVEWLFLMK